MYDWAMAPKDDFRKWHNNLFLALLTFAVSACGTMPIQNLESLQQTPTDKIHSSERDVLEKNAPQLILSNQNVDVSFSSKSPIVKTKFGPSTAATVKLVNDQSKKYLIVWSWLHKTGFGKVGVAFPQLTVFDSKKNVKEVKCVQAGEEDGCGINRCRKMAYDISELDSGTFDLVLVPQVEDPEKILMLSTVNNGVLNPPRVPLYGDYFGEARLSLDSKLPFKEK